MSKTHLLLCLIAVSLPAAIAYKSINAQKTSAKIKLEKSCQRPYCTPRTTVNASTGSDLESK